MTKDEALKLALEALEAHADIGIKSDKAITAIKEALAQPEHGWTPERIAGITRLKEAQDKRLAQRTWAGLTNEEIKDCFKITPDQHLPWHIYQKIEAKLKEKNNG